MNISTASKCTILLICAFFAPIVQLTFFNLEDFGSQYTDAIIMVLAFGICLLPCFWLVCQFRMLSKIALCLCAGIFFTSFLNTFFVPSSLVIIDGRDGVDFLIRHEARYISIAVTLVSIVVCLFQNNYIACKIKHAASLLLPFFCGFCCVFVCYVFFVLPDNSSNILQYFFSNSDKGDKDEVSKRLVLGKKNILILSFDQVQGSLFKGFLNSEKGQKAKKIFEGFRFYPNAVSTYPNTRCSIHSMLLGRAVKKHESGAPGYQADNSIIKVVQKNGYKYYTKGMLVDPKKQEKGLVVSISDVLFLHAFNVAFGVDIQAALRLKNSNTVSAALLKYKWKHMDHIFFNEILPTKIVSDQKSENAIFYHHFMFTHEPFSVDSKCRFSSLKKIRASQNVEGFIEEAECLILGLEKIFSALKRVGAYDNTAIFVISDHGCERNINSKKNQESYPEYFFSLSDYVHSEDIKPLGAFNPLILFKDFHSNNAFQTDEYIASLVDIHPTICAKLNRCSYGYHGVDLTNSDKPLDRVHEVWVYRGGQKLRIGSKHIYHDDLEHWQHHEFDGHLQSLAFLDNDSKGVLHISFNKKNDLPFYQAKGLSNMEAEGRWSDAKEVSLIINGVSRYQFTRLKLTVNAFVTSQHAIQKATVYANDVSLGEMVIQYKEKQPKTFTFDLPKQLNKEDKLKLKFKIENPRSPSELGVSRDARKLGFFFFKLELS